MAIRSNNERTLKEAIQLYFKSIQQTDRIREAEIKAVWEQVAGEQVASYTRDMYLHKQILQVQLRSSVIRQEVFYSKHRLITAINKKFNAVIVKDIILR